MINVLVVIPARGGSKRLPRKNIKFLAGKPLIAYTIEAALQSSLVTDIIFSSEDEEIISVAKEYGALAPFVRPQELATDEVRNIDVVKHALLYMENREKRQYDIVLLLQPTSPVRSPLHIDEAIRLLTDSKFDSIASVKGPFKKRDPILKAIRNEVLEDYIPVNGIDEVEPFYLYNAALYGVKRDYFMKHGKLISPRQIPLVMDQFHSVDVDTEADFLMAEAYINFLNKQNKKKS